MTLKCIVTDDEPIAREGLLSYIGKVDFLEVVAECEDALQLNDVLKSQTVDLLFLDIEMPYMSGIDFLSNLANPPKVIMTTAYEQYAIKGYDLDVIDYLLKPIPFERFLKAVNKAYDIIVNQRNPAKEIGYFYVKTNQKFEKVSFNDILFIEGVENYVAIQTEISKIMTHVTIKTILGKMPDDKFLQIHKSFIINLEKVSFVEGNMVGIGEYKLPVSRTFREKVLPVILQNKV
jgi:DNA-binding LytR/AlgR family response regulator